VKYIRAFIFIIPIILLFVFTSVVYANQGPGLFETTLYIEDMTPVGTVSIWNTREKLHIHVDAETYNTWKIYSVQIYVGTDPVPTTKVGIVQWPKFPYDEEYQSSPVQNHMLILDLYEDLGFSWGEPYEDMRNQNIAVHAMMLPIDADPTHTQPENAWAYATKLYLDLEGELIDNCDFCWGWWDTYEMAHPKRAHF